MAKFIEQIINTVVKTAVDEVLKKVGLKGNRSTTSTTNRSSKKSDSFIGSIIDAALGKPKKAPAKKAKPTPTANKRKASTVRKTVKPASKTKAT